MRTLTRSWLLLPFLVPSTAQPQEIRCSYSRRTVCDTHECRSLATQQAFLLVPTHPLQDVGFSDALEMRCDREGCFAEMEVRMCDGSGCEPIAVRIQENGDFLMVGSVSRSYLLVIARANVDSFTLRGSWRGWGVEQMPMPSMRVGDFVEVKTLHLVTLLSSGRCPSIPPRLPR